MIRLVVLLLLLLPVAAGAANVWDQYQVIMWQDRTPLQMQHLAALGFTATKLRATGGEVNDTDRATHSRSGLPYYLENLATDFYSPYHRYTPGKEVTWLFDSVRARRLADPADATVTVREPGLGDPALLEGIVKRLEEVVGRERAGQPLFYNLADESGIADLAAAWDFDTGAESLAGYREWLRTQYTDIRAVNVEWGTAYPDWGDVRPELTDAALRRTDANFAAWSDFKAWMDVSFARAVRTGTAAVHRADATARAGLEGAQVPGWGGYDYALLAPSVDVMEIYDFGEALDLAMGFNPGLIALRTSFATGRREAHAVWRALLHGGRGMIVWDENDDVVAADGQPGPRGVEIAALVREVRPVAELLRDALPAPDRVGILANQASFRVQWLLDRQAGDHDWASRNAEREYDDNAWRASRRVLVRRLVELGVQPRFLSSEMVEAGTLRDGSVRTLVLSHAIALSDREVEAIKGFQADGGVVLSDGEAGAFDGHGRRRAALPLPNVSHPMAVRPDGEETDPVRLEALAAALADRPRLRMLGPDGALSTGVEARWFSHPQGEILALQAGRPWEAPARLKLQFPGPVQLTNLRRGAEAMPGNEVSLDPIEPTILLVKPVP